MKTGLLLLLAASSVAAIGSQESLKPSAANGFVITDYGELPEKPAITQDVVAVAPVGVVCEGGVCRLVKREPVSSVVQTRSPSPDCRCEDCHCGSAVSGNSEQPHCHRPILRATANVARRVGWRLTHPFGGRFRR